MVLKYLNLKENPKGGIVAMTKKKAEKQIFDEKLGLSFSEFNLINQHGELKIQKAANANGRKENKRYILKTCNTISKKVYFAGLSAAHDYYCKIREPLLKNCCPSLMGKMSSDVIYIRGGSGQKDFYYDCLSKYLKIQEKCKKAGFNFRAFDDLIVERAVAKDIAEKHNLRIGVVYNNLLNCLGVVDMVVFGGDHENLREEAI